MLCHQHRKNRVWAVTLSKLLNRAGKNIEVPVTLNISLSSSLNPLTPMGDWDIILLTILTLMGDWDIILLTILTLMGDWDIILLTISIQYQANRWWGQRKLRGSNPYSSIQEISLPWIDRALNIDNQKIKKTEQIKLLGSYINEYLNFAGHISNLCTKSNQKVGVLVYGCNLIPCNTKLTLYKSAILSHLTYWLLVWNFCK